MQNKEDKFDSVFPNLKRTVAFYSPTSLFVVLEDISEKEFKRIVFEQPTSVNQRNLSVIYHELRHYVDHISTLWGQHHLLKLYRALNARLQNDEHQFHKIIDFKKEQKQLHFAKYYTVLFNNKQWKTADDVWVYRPTSGFRFNDLGEPEIEKPIIFLRFATKDGIGLTRVPVSIASLLETNSTSEEIKIKREFINSLEGLKKIQETQKYNDWVMKSVIYSCDLALYNVVVHLTANILGLSNVQTAFEISSSISTICLNLPYKLLKDIPIQTEVYKEWDDERPKKMMQNHEYGFIFFNLLTNYAETFKLDHIYVVEKLLEVNNLPSGEQLKLLIKDEIESLGARFDAEPNLSDFFRNIHLEGLHLFKSRGIDGAAQSVKELMLKKLFEPRIKYSTSKVSSKYDDFGDISNSTPISSISDNDYYHFSLIMDEKMDEFYEIRGL